MEDISNPYAPIIYEPPDNIIHQVRLICHFETLAICYIIYAHYKRRAGSDSALPRVPNCAHGHSLDVVDC